ncbi:acetyltransferase [Agromyces humi]|uniref:acetyltransferase n=1 Tax=Agromyces humi TaxID=1766800 RepID=UPI00135A6413|nr:acetyltransferase [Agromyces humi]
MNELVVIGGGGFGRETLDVIDAINAVVPTFSVIGVVDDDLAPIARDRLDARRSPYLGTIEEWLRAAAPTPYVIAVGSPGARRAISDRLARLEVQPATLIHPAASIGSQASFAGGTIVCAGAQVSTNVRFGRHVHVNPSATIGHDAVLHDFVSINPGAIISGEAELEEGTLIGAGAVILQGLKVGRNATVGAASCVTRSVTAGSTVKGVPAR